MNARDQFGIRTRNEIIEGLGGRCAQIKKELA
jgi:hypothetical protein